MPEEQLDDVSAQLEKLQLAMDAVLGLVSEEPQRKAMAWSKERVLIEARRAPDILCGVYFLIKKGEVVYVGQSKQFYSRLMQHVHDDDKEFDSYTFIVCDPEEVNALERNYIKRFKPRYNKTAGARKRVSKSRRAGAVHGAKAPRAPARETQGVRD